MRFLALILIATPAVAGPIRSSNCDPGWVATCEPCGECELYEGDDGDSDVSSGVGRVLGNGGIGGLAGITAAAGLRWRAVPAIPAWAGPMPRLPAPDDGYPRGGTAWQLSIPPPESESPVVSGSVPEPSAAWLVAICFLIGARRWQKN